MKQQKIIYKIILVVLLLACGMGQTYASGLGFSFGIGKEKWEQDRENLGDRNINNVGFVVDNAVARNSVFNYRFTFSQEENNADGGNLDMEGYSMTHDFGFGIYRNKHVRLWLGPEIRATYYKDLYLTNTNTPISGDIFGFSAGPVFGVNVNLPEVVSFTFTAAYHVIGKYNGDYSGGGFSDDITVDSTGLYLTAGLIFRIQE